MGAEVNGMRAGLAIEASGRRRGGGYPVCSAVVLGSLLLPLAGCGSFFSCEKASCPTSVSTTTGTGTTTTGSTTNDYAYVANSASGTTYLSQYNIGNGTLNSLGDFQLGYIPVALAVSPNDQYLYVATAPGATNPGIYRYIIGSSGTLTADNGGNVVASGTIAAMAISPDGNWLYTVNVDGATMNEYAVTPTTGALGQPAAVSLLDTPCTLSVATPVSQSCSVTVAQSENYVVVSLGISGNIVYSYNSTNGITTGSGTTGNGVYTLPSGYPASASGNFSAAVNSNNLAFVAATDSVSSYTLTSTGYENSQSYAFLNATGPRSITFNPAGTYVFTADEVTGAVSAFSVGENGAFSVVSGSPTAGPAGLSAIAVDKSGGYVVGVGYDANAGVQLYTLSSAGALTSVAKAGSGTNEAYPALVAVTH